MKVLVIILLILVLVGLIPVGVDAAWREDELSLAVRVWLLSIRLGGEKKEKKKKDKKKKEEPEEEKSGKRKLPPLPVLRLLAKNGYRTLCRLVSKLRTELLRIHFTSAFDDPAAAAMSYAAAGTAMEGLLRVGGNRIRKADLRADVDFDSTEPVIDFRIRITIRIGQILGTALGFGFCFLKDYLRYKKECAQHGERIPA